MKKIESKTDKITSLCTQNQNIFNVFFKDFFLYIGGINNNDIHSTLLPTHLLFESSFD